MVSTVCPLAEVVAGARRVPTSRGTPSGPGGPEKTPPDGGECGDVGTGVEPPTETARPARTTMVAPTSRSLLRPRAAAARAARSAWVGLRWVVVDGLDFVTGISSKKGPSAAAHWPERRTGDGIPAASGVGAGATTGHPALGQVRYSPASRLSPA